MITTEGYRDILHIARHKKPLNFSNYQDLPWQRYPLVRRRYRLTVPERITQDGSVLVPLDEEKAREQVAQAEGGRRRGGRGLLPVLVPEPGARAARRRDRARGVPRGVPLGLVRGAAPVPRVRALLDRLPERLRRPEGRQLRRAGSRTSCAALGVADRPPSDDLGQRRRDGRGAIARPVNLLMSGPVAGVVGGIWAGTAGGLRQRDHARRRRHLGGHRPRAGRPAADEAPARHEGRPLPGDDPDGRRRHDRRRRRLDRLRRRRAASSASARARRAPIPGPAAYGRGGTEATATDAMVNLGWLLPEAFLGGGMALDADLARQAFEDGPAPALGMSVEEASMGAVQILTHSMVQSIEENSVRKGFDPRDFALVAEGGAGPLFAAQIALEVGTPWVVVPPYPGVTAAMGLLATDMVYEYAATVYQRLSKLDADALAARVRGARGAGARASSRRTAFRPTGSSIQRIADCRYLGQGYELRVDVASGDDRRRLGREGARRLPRHPRARVLAALRGLRHRDPERPRPRDRADAAARDARDRAGRRLARRGAALRGEAWFRVNGDLERSPTRYYDRAALKAGNRLEGPAIVNQYDSTTVIPPGSRRASTASGTSSSRSAASAEAARSRPRPP